MHYDVFNGDADGILSLIQLRKHEPKNSILITEVKRNIKLMQKVATEKCQWCESLRCFDGKEPRCFA